MSEIDYVTTKDGKQIPKERLCPCCGNDLLEVKVTRKIRINRKWVNMNFCCMEQGGFYQMGCEG